MLYIFSPNMWLVITLPLWATMWQNSCKCNVSRSLLTSFCEFLLSWPKEKDWLLFLSTFLENGHDITFTATTAILWSWGKGQEVTGLYNVELLKQPPTGCLQISSYVREKKLVKPQIFTADTRLKSILIPITEKLQVILF